MDGIAFIKQIAEGSIGGAYCLCGQEPYVRERAVKKVLSLLNADLKDMNAQVLTNPAASDVINACETLPLFDLRRVVIVRELAADAATALADYAPNVPDTAVLLIEVRGAPNTASALYKALNKEDRVVLCEPFTADRAADFLLKRAREAGGTIDRNAARMLIERLGTDLSQLENALNRLMGFVGQGSTVDIAAVETCVDPPVDASVFRILDALVAGNKRAAISELTALVQSGADTSMRLAAFFFGRVRQMLTARRLLDEKRGEQEIVRALGGSAYAAKKTVQNARKCTAKQLANALEALRDVDYCQKQGVMKDDDALLMALLNNF